MPDRITPGFGPVVWAEARLPGRDSPRRASVLRTGTREDTVIYKICPAEDWEACQRTGQLPWAPVDRADGFVHLSAAHQVQATAAKHFAGRSGLVVLEVDPERLPPESLRWEVSRGGDRFPHVYADIPRDSVVRAEKAPLDEDGVPRLPWGLGEQM